MILNYFKKENISSSIQQFFKELSVPFNPLSGEAIPKNKFFEKEIDSTVKYLSSVDMLYLPITIAESAFQKNLFDEKINSKTIKQDYQGFLVFGIEIKKQEKPIPLSDLANITRAVSREMKNNPVVVFFLTGGKLSIANCERTAYKTNREGEKPGKVSILRDIDLENPHAGHVRILDDLNISKKNINSFRELNEYWLSVFDTSILNKKFYKDIANWYFWAQKKVSFPFELPKDAKETKKDLLPITLIRFLTRLIFVWFLKEKKLIPDSLFDEKTLSGLVEGFSVKGRKTLFYTSILQNLFFGTLNTYRNADSLEESNESLSRKFRNPKRDKQGRTDDYMVTNLYRYESNFKDKKKILELLADVPFLNGGLFECLDRREGKEEPETRLDCFSDIEKKQPNFPDYLFFSEANEIDLSDEYGGDKKRSKESVNGIIRILDQYKFTVEENTPLEEEVALDPELLGKVFENLLASFNPETSTTARKQTGSFYTPREIVNYMVEESLIAYYKNALLEEAIGHTVITSNENVMFPEAASGKRGQLELTAKLDNNPWKRKEEELEKNLRVLLGDGNTTNPFSQSDTEKLVRATGNAKILDPACGSGAFPMGVLHKMVYVLRKLDPENKRWKQEQLDRNEKEKEEIKKRIDSDIEAVSKLHSEDVKKKAIAELEEKKKSIEINFREHEADYARKLYLIENCIYGVDIQPIAVQITKLRFFISLIVDQKINPTHKNLGIIPLPNLETKFVAANTLVGLEKPHEEELLSKKDSILLKLENELNTIRKKYFYSRSRTEKVKLKKDDKTLREKILEHFLSKNDKFKKDLENILKIGRLPKESVKEIFEYIDNRESESASALQQLVAQLCKQNKMDTGISKKAIAECNRYFPPKSASDIASWDPYDQNSHADWFDPEHMFGLLVGFDIVIGNPPYVPLQRIKEITNILETQKYKTFERTGDIYCLFYEKGILSLKSKGILSYITSNSWMRTKYGEALRDYFWAGTNPLQLINFEDSQMFESAIVETNIFITMRDKNQNAMIAATIGNPVMGTGCDLSLREMVVANSNILSNLGSKSWSIGDRTGNAIQEKIVKNGILLGELDNPINSGIKTGLNEAFVIDESTKTELIKSDRKNEKIIMQLLSGKDLKKYYSLNKEKFLIYMHQKISKNQFPTIMDYLKKFKDSLSKRTGGANKNGVVPYEWWQMQTDYFNVFDYFSQPKIIWAKLSNEARFSYDTKGMMLLNTTYFLVGKNLKYLLSVLNSKTIEWYFNLISTTTGMGANEWIVNKVEQLPIPRSPIDNPKLQQPLIALVDKILTAKGKDSLADTSKWENEIDARVFHLYGLTEEEMLTVLGSFPKMNSLEKTQIQNNYRDLERGNLV